jgi:hypothetical protein
MTLLTYFSRMDGNFHGNNSSIYHTDGATHLSEDDIDLAKADELSTLV